MKNKTLQNQHSGKNAPSNPQNTGKTQVNESEKKPNQVAGQKHQDQPVEKPKPQQPQEDKQESALKKIKSAQLFFHKKFLGNKDLSKAAEIRNLLKAPKLFNPEQLIELKTGNLGNKIKEIETIFKAEKKSKLKKPIPPPTMTDFQLYMTKRDVLKQKNQILDSIRILYEEDKKKLQEKKNKKKRKFSTEEAEAQEPKEQKPKKKQTPQKLPQPEPVETIQNLPQLLFPGLYQEVDTSPPLPVQTEEVTEKKKQEEPQNVLLKKQEPVLEPLKPFDDEYFQKKFQQKIVKNKINVESNFSLKSLFKNFETRNTTLSGGEFIKQELNQIENVAKATIENFQVKQKIDRQLYGSNTDFEKIESQLTSKRGTPGSFLPQNEDKVQTQRKSIHWIIKQCDGFKKKFNVRKTKSLKNIKK